MRKNAQERKRAMSSTSSSSSDCSSVSSNPTIDSIPSTETGEESFYDAEGAKTLASTEQKNVEIDMGEEDYSMDDIWKEISLKEGKCITPVYDVYSEGCYFSCPPVTSPSWEYSSDTLWQIDEEENKVFLSIENHLFSHHDIRDCL